MNKSVSFEIDGRPASAPRHEPIIRTASRMGIDIPTLCDHEALLPYGACRLCLVEVENKGRTKLVTACTYPAEEGISVHTSSPAIAKHRRLIAEVLLARCSEVPAIQKLARDMGISHSRFGDEKETCILCGLCARVCETYATGAISILHRGENKQIGTPGGIPPVDCVGCGACAEICPTGHIRFKRSGSENIIWEKAFKIPVAVVNNDRCHLCGACEAACPFSIPRTVLKKDDTSSTEINPFACKGCGVCVAACPAGAISQPRSQTGIPALPKAELPVWVLGCGRTNLGGKRSSFWPKGFVFTEVSCIGQITAKILLEAISLGFCRILVLGRHQETCRLNGAEDHALKILSRADALCELAGLGGSRVVFQQLPPDNDDSQRAILNVAESAEVNPLAHNLSWNSGIEQSESAFDILKKIASREDLQPFGATWLANHDLRAPIPGHPVLLTGILPYFDTLLGDHFGPNSLADALRDCLKLLEVFGLHGGVLFTGFESEPSKILDGFRDSPLFSIDSEARVKTNREVVPIGKFVLDRVSKGDIEIPKKDAKIAYSKGEKSLSRIISALGYDPAPVSPLPRANGILSLDRPMKLAIEKRLVEARDAGAESLVVSNPTELTWHYLASGRGSWQRSLVHPMLATSLALATIEEMGEVRWI